jgi:hypothetical protein
MGLIVSILEDKRIGNCSNGGVSSEKDSLTLVNVEGPFEPDETRPAALLLKGNVPGVARVVPAVEVDGEYKPLRPPAGVGPMMGGAYVATSDSRFGQAVEKITGSRFYGAVALHDRFETPAQYASYD